MTSLSLGDLRNKFYGGGSAAEYAALKEFADAGFTINSLLGVAQGNSLTVVKADVTNVSGATPFAQTTIPGGLLTTGDVVTLEAWGELLSNTTGNLTLLATLDGSTLVGTASSSVPNNANSRHFFMRYGFEVTDENTQSAHFFCNVSSPVVGTANTFGGGIHPNVWGSGPGTIDTSGDVIMAIEANWSAADALLSLLCKGARVRVEKVAS